MNRKEFIAACGKGCLGMFAGLPLLNGCASVRYVELPATSNELLLPAREFEVPDSKEKKYRECVVVRSGDLPFRVAVYRFGPLDYSALRMSCTHRGTELQVVGDRLECPSHGSLFTNRGVVKTGPADKNLQRFKATVEEQIIRIKLT